MATPQPVCEKATQCPSEPLKNGPRATFVTVTVWPARPRPRSRTGRRGPTRSASRVASRVAYPASVKRSSSASARNRAKWSGLDRMAPPGGGRDKGFPRAPIPGCEAVLERDADHNRRRTLHMTRCLEDGDGDAPRAGLNGGREGMHARCTQASGARRLRAANYTGKGLADRWDNPDPLTRGLVSSTPDQGRCDHGHDTRSGGHAGVGTLVITNGAVFAALLHPPRRVPPGHAKIGTLSGALTPRWSGGARAGRRAHRHRGQVLGPG